MTNTNRVDEIIDSLKSCIPDLNEQSQRVAIELYRALSKGVPVEIHDLSEKMDLSPKVLTEIFNSFTGLYKNENKSIIGFWGLTVAMETPHKLTVNNKTMNAWCAWDTLFLPEIIDKQVQIESVCPVMGKKIELTVSPNKIDSFLPQETVLSFLIPENLDENVINKFCHYIHFFSSQNAFEKWQVNNPKTFSISVEEGFLIGKKKNKLKLGAFLGSKEGGSQ